MLGSFYGGIELFSNEIIKSVDTLNCIGKIQNFYHDILGQSIKDGIKAGFLEQVVGKDFYNYVLIDG